MSIIKPIIYDKIENKSNIDYRLKHSNQNYTYIIFLSHALLVLCVQGNQNFMVIFFFFIKKSVEQIIKWFYF